MNNFTFSIVIPAYNAAHTINKTIHSIFQQTLAPKEIIIVDDCSTDNTANIVQQIIAHNHTEIAIHLYQQDKNSGPASARNLGWEKATGDIICFLDSDDEFTSNKLAFLNTHWPTDAHIVINGFSHQATNDTTDHHSWKILSTWSIIKSNKAQGSSINVKRAIAHRFPEHEYYAEDLEFALIASVHQKLNYTSQILTQTSRPQLTEGGLSAQKWKMRKGELRAFHALSKMGIQWKLIAPALYLWSLIKHLVKIIK